MDAVAQVVGMLALLRYLYLVPLFFRYLRRARVRAIPKGDTPPISLLKPLYGADPGLRDNLIATLRQNYPRFEVLFLHERPDDPALAEVEAATRAVPDVETRTIAGRDAEAANPKVAVLARGGDEARYDIVASADSDVRPDPLYLRDIANGLAEADVVSFAPVLFGMRTLPARIMGLSVDTEAILSAIALKRSATTGSTIAVRREALERIGGYRAVGDRIADDYALGKALRDAGCKLTLARRAARLYNPGEGWAATARHWVRWGRTIRAAAPLVFAAWLPFAIAPALLIAAGTPRALAILALLTAMRVAVAVAVDLRFCWDRSLVRSLWLLPAVWIAEPICWLASLFGRTVEWRGRRYRLIGGRATLVRP